MGKAEGTAFMHAVVGRVNAASPTAAATLLAEMNAEGTFDHVKVKDAFESVYDDLGITCEQVGELLDDSLVAYEGMKDAFESVYDDLGITCEQVGEFLDDSLVAYEGMEACKTKCTDKPGKKNRSSFYHLQVWK